MFALAERNGVAMPFASVEEVRAAYAFSKLQDFLDIYYAGAAVLRDEHDFHDLAAAYFDRVAADGVVHAEIMFDPQTHTARGVAVRDGDRRAAVRRWPKREARHGMTVAADHVVPAPLSEEDGVRDAGGGGAVARPDRGGRARFVGAGPSAGEVRARLRRGRAKRACGWSRMPARKGRPNTSTRRSTCSASTGSTMAIAAWRIRC